MQKQHRRPVAALLECTRLRDRPDDARLRHALRRGRPSNILRFRRKCMTRILRFIGALVLAGLAVPAAAQVQTGSILVKATDQQGAVAPGVTVTISSPVLVAGSMTGVTDSGGVYRFPSLIPGTYAIKMELSGFQTINRENLLVLVGQTTPIDFQLKVATIAENVTVT